MTMQEIMNKTKEKVNQAIVDLTPLAKKCGQATVEAAKETSAFIAKETPIVVKKVREGVHVLMTKLQKPKKESTTETPQAPTVTPTPATKLPAEDTTVKTDSVDNKNPNKP